MNEVVGSTGTEGVSGDVIPVVEPTAGSLLRAAREQQGVHLAVLAASLKVAPRKLELLESDRHAELPDATFARALALSMCRALKIDPEPVLSRLPQPHSQQRLDALGGGLNQSFRDHEASRESEDWQRYLTLPVLGAALLIVGAVVLYFVPIRWPSGAPAAPLAADAPPAGPAPVRQAASAIESSAAQVSPPVPPTDVGSVPTATAGGAVPAASEPGDTVFLAPRDAAVVPADASASAPVPTVGAGGILSLRADGSSWVEVRTAAGQVLLSRTLASGETATVDGAAPLRVTVGNAAVTRLVFRGQPVDLADSTRDNVARLELQ